MTLVRPVCGVDHQARETLGSSFFQSSRSLEVLFCVAREDDPATGLVRALIAEHPHVNARLLVGEDLISANPKLNNMAKGWRAAAHDCVVFADSNLALPPDYCARVAHALADPTIGVVSSPPVGSAAEGFWGEVECAMLNGHAARWQFAASAVGLGFAQGKTLGFRKSALRGDLMWELGREPAEDAAATKVARARGLRVGLLAPAFLHPVGPRSLAAVWSRHLRWARLRRATFPALFACEIATGALPPLAALHVSGAIASAPLVWTLAFLAAWYGAEYAMVRSAGWPASLRAIPAAMARDVMLPCFYVGAWLGRRFEWRGSSMAAQRRDEASAPLLSLRSIFRG